MRRTRLLFVDHASTVGGGERSMLELARALDRQRFHVAFAVPGPGPLARGLAGAGESLYFYKADPLLLDFHREAILPFSLGWWRQVAKVFAAARNLRGVIAAEHPDLIHTHSQKAHVFATLAAWGKGVPVIWHMRDVLLGRFARGIMDLLAAVAVRRVIAISQTVASQFKLARRKVAVVYNAVAEPRPLDREAAVRIRSGWAVPRDGRVVGCVGQMAPWKGQHIFVQAGTALAPAFPDLYFVVVGSTLYGANEYGARLVRAVRRAGLAARFRFVGQQEDAGRAIGAFHVLVHTPVEPEPFGRVVVEAMARRVPVVASRSGGIPEIIEDGREGFLVEVGNPGAVAAATAFLLDDPQLAAEMGAQGRATYERRFTVERLCREVNLIYREVLGRPSRSRKSPVTLPLRRQPGRLRERVGAPSPGGVNRGSRGPVNGPA